MSLSTLPLVLFPDTLYDIPKKQLASFNIIYIVEDPNYFTMWPFTKIKLAYMRACMQNYFQELVKKQNKNKVIYIESTDFYSFFKQLTQCTMYYPNDLGLKQRYEKKANISYINECPNFLLSIDDDLYQTEKTIKRHSAFYRRMKDKFSLLQSTENQDKLNRSKPNKDYQVATRPKYSNDEYLNAAKYVFKNFYENPGAHKNAEDLVAYLKHYPVTRAQSVKHFKYFLKKYYSGFKFQDYIDKDKVFVNHSNISCVLNNGLLSAKYVVQEAFRYGKQNNIAINNIEGFIRQILGWREYMRYVYHMGECNEMYMGNYKRKYYLHLTEEFWSNSSNNLVIHREYEKVMKYGYSHHIVRLMVFLNMMKLKNIYIEDIIEWFSCVHIDAYPWVMYSNVLAMGYYNRGYMSKAYVSSSNYIVKNSNYKKNGKWDKEWDRLYRIFVSKSI